MSVKRRVAFIEKKVTTPTHCAACRGERWQSGLVLNRAGKATARLWGCPESGYTGGVKT